jgi:hypothetical protein
MSARRVILTGCGLGYRGQKLIFLIFRTIGLTYF